MSYRLLAGMYKNRSHDLSWALICMSGSIIVSPHLASPSPLFTTDSWDDASQALNYPLRSVIFFRALLLAMTHLWAQFSPEQPMNLYGFITIPAKYLSYALLALDLVQGGGYTYPYLTLFHANVLATTGPTAAMEGLTGIISAHVYWYLTEVYPRANPGSILTRYLSTPAWYKKLWNVSASNDGQARERNLGGGVTGFRPSSGAPRPASGRSSTTAAAAAPSRSSTQTTSGHQWGRGNRLGTD